MYNKKYSIIFTICLVSIFSLSLRAQDEGFDKKRYSEDLLKIYNPWLSTQNNSGLYYLNEQEKITELSVNYNNTSGEFARTMDASDINQYSLSTYSYQKYKNIGLFGKFEYQNSYEKNTHWKDVMNPYSGNPFILGDEIGGDYHKELFHLAGGMSSAFLLNNSIWGVGVEYTSGTGGKDSDPRPLNKVMKAAINPGLIFNLKDVRLGINFKYAFTKEEIAIKSFVDNESYKIFQFRGLGLYTFDNVSNFNRNYFTNKYAGNIQIGFNIGAIENITEAGFSYKRENIEDGTSTIKDFGFYEEENISLKSNFIYKTDNYIHKLIVSGGLYDRLGAINILRKEPDGFTYTYYKYGENRDYTQKSKNISLYYAMYKMDSKYVQHWKAELRVEYFDQNTKYKFDPEVFEEDYQGIDFKMGFTKNFTFNNKSTFAVHLYGAYKYNLDKKLYILNNTNKGALLIDNISDYMVEEIVILDYEWATSNILRIGGSMKYAFDVNTKNSSNSAYIKLSTDYINATEGVFDGKSRTNLAASVGLLF